MADNLQKAGQQDRSQRIRALESVVTDMHIDMSADRECRQLRRDNAAVAGGTLFVHRRCQQHSGLQHRHSGR